MFRLTRDIVDGFGPSGVEGTFRRCCEETMRVLRESKDDILTILEVLTHDPLYNWSMTPEKAFKIQGRHSVQSRHDIHVMDMKFHISTLFWSSQFFGSAGNLK